MMRLPTVRPAAAFFAACLLPAVAVAVEVRFETNDAHVRDLPVAGVRLLVAAEPGGEALVTGETDDEGVAVLDLEPGTYWVSYVRGGYVPIGDSETEIRGTGQIITTTLSMLLEAEGGDAHRRVRIILNWGSAPSNVQDADSHVACVCGQSDRHVYFAAMRHESRGHVVELDVDDRDWGGPETLTLSDPAPGSYDYWVHQYSSDEDPLGLSDVVVRVFFDDALEKEIRIPSDVGVRHWWPFKELVVAQDLTPSVVPFSAAELAAGADRRSSTRCAWRA